MRLIEARFGYEKGSLISTFPASWFDEVLVRLQASNSASQIDKLTDLLRQIQVKALHKYGRDYLMDPWLNAANASHATQPFHRILESSKPAPPIHLENLYELKDEDFDLITHCKRTAEEMSKVAAELLKDAEKITLVDPFATPDKIEYEKTLLKMANITTKPHVEFIIFSEEEKQQSNFELRKNKLSSIQEKFSKNIKLTWCFLDDGRTGYIHKRVLFTSKGGINFDRGFSEPRDIDQKNSPNDLTILTRSQLEKFSSDFNYAQITEPLKICHLWQSDD
ncbi:MAG: hypothetical protein Q8K02_16095 [Flavobacterium sp.]|nr:hypothetical protein [Flavobacterium sp.]